MLEAEILRTSLHAVEAQRVSATSGALTLVATADVCVVLSV